MLHFVNIYFFTAILAPFPIYAFKRVAFDALDAQKCGTWNRNNRT